MALDYSTWPFSTDSCLDPEYRRNIVELAEKIESLIRPETTVGELAAYLRLRLEEAD